MRKLNLHVLQTNTHCNIEQLYDSYYKYLAVIDQRPKNIQLNKKQTTRNYKNE